MMEREIEKERERRGGGPQQEAESRAGRYSCSPAGVSLETLPSRPGVEQQKDHLQIRPGWSGGVLQFILLASSHQGISSCILSDHFGSLNKYVVLFPASRTMTGRCVSVSEARVNQCAAPSSTMK